jgi:hypothetical protein
MPKTQPSLSRAVARRRMSTYSTVRAGVHIANEWSRRATYVARGVPFLRASNARSAGRKGAAMEIPLRSTPSNIMIPHPPTVLAAARESFVSIEYSILLPILLPLLLLPLRTYNKQYARTGRRKRSRRPTRRSRSHQSICSLECALGREPSRA